MTRAPWLGLTVAIVLAIAPAASAQAPCPAGTPAPTFTVNGKVAPVYSTHELLVRVRQPGAQGDFSVVGFDVTGVRKLPHPDGDEASPAEIYAIGDSAGTLTATATLSTTNPSDPDGAVCQVSGSANFEVRQATAPAVSKLRRPRPFRAVPGLTFDSDFRFNVTPGPTGARTPLTVEARTIMKARVPGPGVRAARHTIALRPSDFVEKPDKLSRGNCSDFVLVCPPEAQGHDRGAEVSIFEMGGRVVPTHLKIQVRLPRGYPLGRFGRRGFRATPVGVDVQVKQEGRAFARLRIAARCISSGQFTRCRYRKISTAL